MHSFIRDKEIKKCHQPNAQHRKAKIPATKIFSSLYYYLLQNYALSPSPYLEETRFTVSAGGGGDSIPYFLLFLILDTNMQILQRNKQHYSGMSRSLPNGLTITPLVLLLWSLSLPQSTEHYPQLPFYLLAVIMTASLQSIWTHKSLSVP